MSTRLRMHRLVGGAICVLALGACATTPKKLPMAEMMTQAAAAETAGKPEAAITLWKQAAEAYPADKEPWLEIAQARYDAGKYGEAIVSAEEILVRDPNDQLANSIIATSGLRLSIRALSDLSRQNNLSGSVRTESVDLAKLLRESLGQDVLFDPEPKKPVRSQRNRTRSQTATPPAKPQSANPFSGLE